MINVNHEMYALELLSSGDTCIHRLHPLAKLLAAAVFIATVVSFDKYTVARFAPYFFYPLLLMALSRTPHSMLYKRLLLALPFCLFVGVSNLALDRGAALHVGGVPISYGAVSFASILCRAYLCVMAALVLISVTRLRCLANELARLGAPNVLIAMLEVTYRYTGILINEAHSMYIAYSLRAPRRRGIAVSDMGPFVGQLLLKSFDRADRVYGAMKCRGYAISDMKRHRQGPRPFAAKDAAYLALVAGLCVLFRFFDVYSLAG